MRSENHSTLRLNQSGRSTRRSINNVSMPIAPVEHEMWLNRKHSFAFSNIQQFALDTEKEKIIRNNWLMTHNGTEHKQSTIGEKRWKISSSDSDSNEMESFVSDMPRIISVLALLLPPTSRDELFNEIITKVCLAFITAASARPRKYFPHDDSRTSFLFFRWNYSRSNVIENRIPQATKHSLTVECQSM